VKREDVKGEKRK